MSHSVSCNALSTLILIIYFPRGIAAVVGGAVVPSRPLFTSREV